MPIGWLSHSKLTENILGFRAARSPRFPYRNHETRFPHSVQSTLNTSRCDTLSQRETRIDVRGKAPREPCHYRSGPVTIFRTIPTAPWPGGAHPHCDSHIPSVTSLIRPFSPGRAWLIVVDLDGPALITCGSILNTWFRDCARLVSCSHPIVVVCTGSPYYRAFRNL